MIEFIVVALFLVPLMISLPIIAKFYEVKNKTSQMARYLSWENTVYGHQNTNGLSKTNSQFGNELISRILTKSDMIISSNTGTFELDDSSLPWDPMLIPSRGKKSGSIILEKQFSTAEVTLNNSLNASMSAALSGLSITGFAIESNGLMNFTASQSSIIPDWFSHMFAISEDKISFQQSLAMYSDTWASASPSENTKMVQSLMPMNLLPTELIQNILSATGDVMPWSDKWTNLKMGHVDVVPVPSVYLKELSR